jgi:hypothetical protein
MSLGYQSAYQSGMSTLPNFNTPNFLGVGSQQFNFQQPNIRQFLPSFEQTYSPAGLGAYRQNPLTGPSVQQFWGSMLNDYNLANQLNQANFGRNQQAADMFLGATQASLQDIYRNVTPGVQTAFAFQQAGQQQAEQDYQRYLQDLARTRQGMDQVQQNVANAYEQALQQAGQGYNQVASDMARAIAQRKESDLEQMMGEIGAFAGTEGQLEEAKRQRGASYDREMFGTLAGLQAQTSKEKADILQRKGDVFANLGTAMSNLSATLDKTTFDVGERRNAWNELGANLGMASAQLFGSISGNVAQLTQAGYGQYASMIQANPILGATFTPTLISMAEVAQRYGQPGGFIGPDYIGPGGPVYGRNTRVPRLMPDGTYRLTP